MHRTKINLNEQVLRLGRQIEPDFIYPTTVSECSQLLREAKKTLRDIGQERHTNRHNDSAIQIAALNATGLPSDRSKAIILTQLQKTETISAVHKKIKAHMKSSSHQSITRVEVPINPSDNPKTCTAWKVIGVPSEVSEVLQKRNRTHFGQAHGTPFTIEPLAGSFGYSGCTLAGRQVLHGNFDVQSVEEPSASTILRHMKKPHTHRAYPIHPEIDLDSFVSKLRSWRESTSTSPSGMHLGHYRAMVSRHAYSDRDSDDPDRKQLDNIQRELSLLHLRLINYALTRGYSYTRWQQVINSMLWKEPGNIKIHRTRVIHIYEADYNLSLGLKWRGALFRAEKLGTLHAGQYGSRPRKSAYDPAVLLEVLQIEVSRITRKSLVQMNFDAAACYDRIIPCLANLASQKFGVSPTVAQMNVATVEKMFYRLRTGLGITTTGYSHSEDNPIYGMG